MEFNFKIDQEKLTNILNEINDFCKANKVEHAQPIYTVSSYSDKITGYKEDMTIHVNHDNEIDYFEREVAFTKHIQEVYGCSVYFDYIGSDIKDSLNSSEVVIRYQTKI